MGREHRYDIATQWTGNLGTGTPHYRGYSRNHEVMVSGKSAPILGSADEVFRGNTKRYNPEELLVAALSSCHMLWLLHLCADAGISVLEYSDQATGLMVENDDGSGQFVEVVLRPRMRIADPARTQDALALHAQAHGMCFIARSVNFPVRHEPHISG